MMKRVEGLTLIEVLVAVSIIALVSTVSIYGFIKTSRSQALSKNSYMILTVLNQARSHTLASKDNSAYGVYFEANRMILFKGEVFNPSDEENKSILLPSTVSISTISLSGQNQVAFERLTGRALQYGTLVLTLVSDPADIQVITIHRSGVSEIN
jgi:prepilin-type N-terminal cleavage/methylation domain-containing protein